MGPKVGPKGSEGGSEGLRRRKSTKLSGPRQRRLDVDALNMVSAGGFCSIPGPKEFYRFLFFVRNKCTDLGAT